MKRVSTKSQEKFLILAGVLGLAGLATALLYVLHSTPYTMVLFMTLGIAMIGAAALMFAFVIVRDIRSRLASMAEQTFEAGEVLFDQGDQPEFMYVITEGEVEFIAEEEGKEATRIGRLGAPDYFGEMSILSDTPYQATAKAFTDVKVLAIHRRDFKSMYAHLPDLKDKVRKEQERKASIVEQELGRS